MTYISWASLYEGSTDRSYFDVLIPRIMEELTQQFGKRAVTIPINPAVDLGVFGRNPDRVAQEVESNASSFHLLFLHLDVGGRAQEATLPRRIEEYVSAIRQRCDWREDRCIIVAPRHETEAWVMADPKSVCDALGYRGPLDPLGLPVSAADAERLPDPKAVLERAVSTVSGRRARRGGSQIFSRIAQIQPLAELRGSQTYRRFEENLKVGLSSLGCL